MKVLLFLFFSFSSLLAQVFSDNAGNYAGVWASGNNGGTGFLAWGITSNNDGSSVFAGTFIGSSTLGAGDINTSGVSLGMYANPGTAFANADRAFSASLPAGSSFSFKLALNFDNGYKGFNLYAGAQGEVFNFNVGSGASVSASGGATLTPGAGSGYNYGGSDAVINVSISVLTASSFSYTISRTSSLGFQGTLFSGTVSGLTELLSGFRFYISGTDNGAAENNLYINSFTGNNTLPVELTSFTAELVEKTVKLKWQTAAEVNNYGFEVEKTSAAAENKWQNIGFVNGSGNSNSDKQYSFLDESVEHGKYLYRLKQVDNDGQYEYSDIVEVDVNLLPSEFMLEQNYPNPFNPSTTIKFGLPRNGYVNLRVYNIIGEEVAQLINKELEAGYHTAVFESNNLGSGIYFYSLNIEGSFTSVKKMFLIK